MKFLDFIMERVYLSIWIIGLVGFVYLLGLFLIWISEAIR